MKKWIIAAALVFNSLFSLEASTILGPGTYKLHNHPDGNAANPLYGLRLDGLGFNGYNKSSKDIFTFDFDDKRSDMKLDYDGNSIRIYGTSFGGLDIGNKYSARKSGLWEIDFLYDTRVSQLSRDDDIIVNKRTSYRQPFNQGTIKNLTTNEVTKLFDYQGKHSYTFQLGDEKNDKGHRGFAGISGWGWLNHGHPYRHVSASDWLFTVGDKHVPVPEPSTYLILGTFLAFTVYSRGRMKAPKKING